jgi:hypothetical protein
LKTDKQIRDVFARLNRLLPASGNGGNGKANNGISSGDDDEFRMAYYRYYRINNSTDEYRKKTAEAAYDSITQDELDYNLKKELIISPEQRYQHRKANWFFHESSAYARGLDREDGYGCNGIECISDCRYAAEEGRIEDAEVIEEHKALEADYRRQNKIVNIEIDDRDYNKFLKIFLE